MYIYILFYSLLMLCITITIYQGMNPTIEDHTLIVPQIVWKLIGFNRFDFMLKRSYKNIFSVRVKFNPLLLSYFSSSLAKRHCLWLSNAMWFLTTCPLTPFVLNLKLSTTLFIVYEYIILYDWTYLRTCLN